MPKVQRKTLQPISQTGRWLHAGIGAGAAIATILASAHSCGLLGAEGSRLSVTNLAAHWVGLTPVADTAESLGDTLRFVATITDRRGATLVGATLRWEIEDTAVATVDSAGFVVARSVGVTNVVTRVGDRVAKARVLVRPRVAHMQLDRDSLVIPESGQQIVSALAFDAREHQLARRQPALVSADTAIVSVRENRLVAVAPGNTVVTGRIDEAIDSIVVEVTPVPVKLAPVRGNGQRAPAGTRLSEAITLRVEARGGRPMAGVVVGYAAANGSGSAQPESAVTDERGLATTSWTLGDSPGLQHLTASVAGLDSVAAWEAEAEPVATNTRILPLDDSLDAPAGASMASGIRVTDSAGRMLPGVPVSWTALGGGKVESGAARTDSLGESRVTWRLGPRSGAQRLRVMVGTGRTVPPRILTAMALSGDPARLELTGAAPKDPVAGLQLSRPIIARVTDAVGNQVPGVRLVIAPGSGAVAESTLVTDTNGRALVRWTLGHAAGDQRLTITASKLQPVIVAVSARPGTVANISLSGTPATAPAGKRLAKPVRVLVTDVYGNPVPERMVVIQASSGSISPARLMTDNSGTAGTTWTLGSKTGVQRLTASVSKTGIKQTIEIEAVKPR